jgi:hypothetical protein
LFLILKEEYRLRVFKNSVLRKIFGPKRNKVTGVEKIHNEEFCDLLLLTKYSHDQIKIN